MYNFRISQKGANGLQNVLTSLKNNYIFGLFYNYFWEKKNDIYVIALRKPANMIIKTILILSYILKRPIL